MISPLDAAVLGIVEGLTEFVPVSSTGHLILVGHWLGHSGPAADAFEIVIQLGALLACAAYYRGVLTSLGKGLVRREAESIQLALALVCGFVPTAIAGLLFHKAVEARLFGPLPVAGALIVGGLVMIAIERWRSKTEHLADDRLAAVTPRRGLLIGTLQCASLWPGTSRSMSSILGGQLTGLSTRVAADFSFLLGIPTLGAACLYKLLKARHLLMTEIGPLPLLVGLLVAFVVGWLVIAGFLRYLRRTGLAPFGLYRVLFGVAILLSLPR